MSRKSAASLAVVTSIPGQRPRPPKGLTTAQAAIWKAVVATKPHDWFNPDSYPLLIAYCRHTATADALGARIDAVETLHAGPDLGGASLTFFADLGELLKMRDRETKAIISLARQMRLSQQSMIRADAAGAGKRQPAGERKPWQ